MFNLGDRRYLRDATSDSALQARLADPEKTAREDAERAEKHAADINAADTSALTGARIKELSAQFGEWAVVADVLASEGLVGELLAKELAKCRTEAPTADAWMRQNF